MASLYFAYLLPSTQHSLAAQPCPSLKRIFSRVCFAPCFCSPSPSATPSLLSILDKPPLSENRADFTSLISYFQPSEGPPTSQLPIEEAEKRFAPDDAFEEAPERDSASSLEDQSPLVHEQGQERTALEQQAPVSSSGENDMVSTSAGKPSSIEDVFSRTSQELELAGKYDRVPHTHWAALLRGLCDNGELEIAIRLLNWIRKYRFKVYYDELFGIIINGLGRSNRFSDALAVADQLEVKGPHIYNALLGACWINHEYSHLLDILQNMKKDGLKVDIGNYVFAIQACMKQRVKSHVTVALYESILKDLIPIDERLYNDVLYAIASAGDVKQSMRVLRDMRSAGFVPNLAAYNAVIFALGQTGRMDEVETILEEMRSCGRTPKIRTYNNIIRGYTRKGQLDQAEEVLKLLGGVDVEPDERTYCLMIDACTKAGKLDRAWALFQSMRLAGLEPGAFIHGRLMTAFKKGGQWQGAIKTLRKMQQRGVPLNRHVYNITIDSFGKHRQDEKALETFQIMRDNDIQPDTVSWNSLIECQFRAGKKDKALQIFSMMKAEDSVTYTILVDVYGRSGRFQDAFECLEIMRTEAPEPEPAVYCALANALARLGLCEQAVGVFKKMEADGIKANLLMLNSVLNAFSVAGKAGEALSVFNYIVEYGMTPDRVTYTTLMKAYIKAEQFDTAIGVFDQMMEAGLTPDRKAKEMRKCDGAADVFSQYRRGD
ncbi:hypothetical protein GOP47_0005501 [Adiantum capillus-veneris]|uniref:PROP1-like PPR domain-containing protein n=1 Tax=Adiantum capillus-veneris TaxID=13818 RepID=A0A9D4V6V1_ADICA|nr:hypothetical protein GOP47_0005501 [Adiantum capillus-veneris]